jgi:hypothetical protein
VLVVVLLKVSARRYRRYLYEDPELWASKIGLQAKYEAEAVLGDGRAVTRGLALVRLR